MHGDDAKQNDYIVANAPENRENLAVEDHNISVVFQFEILLLADTVAKVFLRHWAQIFRAVGAALEKPCGGRHHCELNSQATSVTRLRA